jgi:Region found in RelA / SpoT proteins
MPSRCVRDISKLEELVKSYEKGRSKNPTKRHEFVSQKDYVKNPKCDGYRSIHFVYRYRSRSAKHKLFNGLKIEIQLRSRLQHAWATAVETVSIFTGQALKSSGGEAEWRRFFVLMGSALALREKTPLVPETPTEREQIIGELREAAKKLNVEELLTGWSYALRGLPAKNVTDAVTFLVKLDTQAHTFSISGFKQEELPKASEAYLAMEKEIASNPAAQAVLVSVDSAHALRSAYPNYFLDTRAFLKALRFAIR